MTENEENLRDLSAMFAMTGLLMQGRNHNSEVNLASMAFEIADQYMAARKPDGGIATIKKRKKDVPES